MNKKIQLAALLSITALWLAGCEKTRETSQTAEQRDMTGDATGQGSEKAPDNTGVNTRDRRGENVTAQDQSQNPADVTMTQQIRQAIVADSSLSLYAKNIKIITRDGTVTLRGPVKDEKEKSAIGEKAKQIAGQDKVNNELEVAG